MSGRLENILDKGLYLDSHISAQPQGTYRFALNVTNRDHYQRSYKSNEHSNRKIFELVNKIAGKKYIEEINSIVYILENKDIWLHNTVDDTIKFVCRPSEFNCDWEIESCKKIKIEAVTKVCDTHIYFSAKNVYYWVNLSEMLNPKRKKALISKLSGDCKDCKSNCNYFRVFKLKRQPTIDVQASSVGGSLPAAAYAATARLVNNDGSATNWCIPSICGYVGSEHNIVGEDSNGIVRFTFNNLDCEYQRIEIAVISYQKGSLIARVQPIREFTSTTFTFNYYHETGDPIDINELLLTGQMNLNGDGLIAYNGEMYYYNTILNKPLNLQPFVNNIKPSWYVKRFPIAVAKENNIKTYSFGEAIALGICFNWDDGTHTMMHHIPNGSINSSISNNNDLSQESSSSPVSSVSPVTSRESLRDNSTNTLFNLSYEVIKCDNSDPNSIIIVSNVELKLNDIVKCSDNICYKVLGPTSTIATSSIKYIDSYNTCEECKKLSNNDSSSGSNSGSGTGSSGTGFGASASEFTFSTEPEYKRERGTIPNTVSNLDNEDDLTDIEKTLVDSYTTEIEDLSSKVRSVLDPDALVGEGVGFGGKDPAECCDEPKDELNQFSNVKDAHKDADLIDKDLKTAEEIGVKWASLLGDYIGREGKDDLITSFTPSNIKQAAQEIITAVKNRERITIKGRQYSLVKNIDYKTSGKESKKPQTQTEVNLIDDDVVYVHDYYGGNIIYEGDFKVKTEESTYPCIRDCDGNFIYGDARNTPIKHFLFPDETEVIPYENMSLGVPSIATPDVNEHSDSYIHALGIKLKGIDLDAIEKAAGKKLNNSSPYTIGEVPLTDANKTILTKGIAFGNYVSSNNGKQWVYQRNGNNSFETVSRYIDIDGKRIDASAQPHDSVCIYSLDQSSLKPYVGSAQFIKPLFKLDGIGYRHCLYSKGRKADNKTFGRRIDNLGTQQAANLNHISLLSGAKISIKFALHVSADKPIEPGLNGDIPLMNKFGQECIWVQGYTISETDKSFIGDVLNHHAPISYAFGHYVALVRDLPDQFGPLENLSYKVSLEAKGRHSGIAGLSGDRFIGHYSFVKTAFISEKIGNKFKIGNLVSGKADRCYCDVPEDAINSFAGKNVWTELPEDSDLADPKNWAGLHSLNDETTDTWVVANAKSAPETDYYGPHFLKHLTTFMGESELNPHLPEIGNRLDEQRYGFLRSQYTIHSGQSAWDSAYLALAYGRREQPSMAERISKILIRSIINIIVPAFKIGELFTANPTEDLLGQIASMGGFIAVMLLFSKVLFTDEFINEIIGIGGCKMDEEGGIQIDIQDFFINYNKHSLIFSQPRDLKTFQAITEEHICGCNGKGATNHIWISDTQIDTSPIDAYKIVRPNNYEVVPQSSGKVIDLYILNGSLYAHTTDAIYALFTPQTEIKTNTFDLIVGQKRIQPKLFVGSNPEGYAGIASSDHTLNCALGHFFVDYEAGILYHQTNNIVPISFQGADTFFRANTKFTNKEDGCKYYYTLGYDPKLQRVLITKSDGNESWTLSYDPIEKQFVSFHSYIPTDYVFTRDKIYHINDQVINIHDELSYTYCNFNGKDYESYIDITHTNKNESFSYESHTVYSDAQVITKDSVLYSQDQTFKQIAFWNARQTAGVHTLYPLIKRENHLDNNIEDKYGIIPAKLLNNSWQINKLFDYTEDSKKPVVEIEKCRIFVKPNNFFDLEAIQKQNARNRRLVNTWFVTRLWFNNTIKLYLQNVVLVAKSNSNNNGV